MALRFIPEEGGKRDQWWTGSIGRPPPLRRIMMPAPMMEEDKVVRVRKLAGLKVVDNLNSVAVEMTIERRGETFRDWSEFLDGEVLAY
jgi:hypothetical protein